MNWQQHLFLKLGEECNEVAKECAKIITFGPDSTYPGDPRTNLDRLRAELQDVLAVIEMLNEDANLCFTPSPEAAIFKRRKVEHYAQIANQLGQLTL